MAAFSGPDIVKDGLVLYLDAANDRSYPGTGTAWSDLSGNSNNGTLVNGVGYNSGNLGSLSFDGVNDYVSTPTQINNISTLTNFDYTINITFLLSSFTSNDSRLVGAYNGSTNQFSAGWTSTTFRLWLGASWNNTTIVSELNKIYYISIAHDNLTTYVYLDGILKTTISNKASYFNNLGFFSPFILNYGSYGNGKMYTSSLYDRALSEQEIKQNFNATRSRFGI